MCGCSAGMKHKDLKNSRTFKDVYIYFTIIYVIYSSRQILWLKGTFLSSLERNALMKEKKKKKTLICPFKGHPVLKGQRRLLSAPLCAQS